MKMHLNNVKEVPPATAAKFLLIVPLMIVTFNEDLIPNGYLDTILDNLCLIAFGLLFCHHKIFSFFRLVDGSYKQTIKAVFMVFAFNLLFTMVGVWLVGPNAQGLQDTTYNLTDFLKSISLLPLIGFGEEFLKLLVFFGFFSLLPGSKVFRFTSSVLISSAIFGFLHAFHYPIAGSIPLALGAIPTVFLTIYYQSLWPAIIQHTLWDGLHFLSHFESGGSELASLLVYIVVIIYWGRSIFKGRQKKHT